jgi:CubicO group peptidase (beta-lactamase class C family)
VRTGTTDKGRTALAIALTVLVVFGAFTVSCSSESPTTKTKGPVTFVEVDAAIGRRVGSEGLDGAALLVVQGGHTFRNTGYAGYDTTTVVPIASASKWLTAATMLTLVDEGRVSLDASLRQYLPEFTGTSGDATIRQLLSHTSGIAPSECIWDEQSSLQACATKIARTKPSSAPGQEFAYGNTSFSLAGRIIEVVTGLSFEDAFEQRIAGPVAMPSTAFDGSFYPTVANPVPAASAQSNLDDYGRFVKMISQGGVIDGFRVLSESSVLEMERDQVTGLDTSSDSAVRTTGIPTYGLGTWRDVTTADDRGIIVSGNGAYGFYPWIDRARNSFGVFLVFDDTGSDVAVPKSQSIVHSVWLALDNETGLPDSPPTTTFGRWATTGASVD